MAVTTSRARIVNARRRVRSGDRRQPVFFSSALASSRFSSCPDDENGLLNTGGALLPRSAVSPLARNCAIFAAAVLSLPGTRIDAQSLRFSTRAHCSNSLQRSRGRRSACIAHERAMDGLPAGRRMRKIRRAARWLSTLYGCVALGDQPLDRNAPHQE